MSETYYARVAEAERIKRQAAAPKKKARKKAGSDPLKGFVPKKQKVVHGKVVEQVVLPPVLPDPEPEPPHPLARFEGKKVRVAMNRLGVGSGKYMFAPEDPSSPRDYVSADDIILTNGQYSNANHLESPAGCSAVVTGICSFRGPPGSGTALQKAHYRFGIFHIEGKYGDLEPVPRGWTYVITKEGCFVEPPPKKKADDTGTPPAS